jgi:hypothetical protein
MPKLLNWCEKCESYDWACNCGTMTVPARPNSIETRLASKCFGEAIANGGSLTDYVLRADGSGVGMAQFAGPAFQPTTLKGMSGEEGKE